MFVVLAFVLIVAVTTALPKLVHENCRCRLKSLKLILYEALFIKLNRLPRAHLRMVFLAFNIFFLFNIIILSASIKTDKVTIPTAEIVDSTAKLFGTSKTLVLNSRASGLLKTAPEGSFFKRLAKKNIFALSKLSDLNQVKTEFGQVVLFAEQLGLFYHMSLLSVHAKEQGLVAFVEPIGSYESLDGAQMRRSLDEQRKNFINRR